MRRHQFVKVAAGAAIVCLVLTPILYFQIDKLLVWHLADFCASLASPVRNPRSFHLFSPPGTKSAWEARKAWLRNQLLFSAGLMPKPELLPLSPSITAAEEADEFVVKDVRLETLPGCFLTGSLYIPKASNKQFPAVLCAHGHWEKGRLQAETDIPAPWPFALDAAPGRVNEAALCANLARAGFVAFSYDMIGYNQAAQLPHMLPLSPELNSWAINSLGLQLLNSMRAVDLLESLPFVDSSRIGVTGASGGATQAMLLSAVDERIKCTALVAMVSAYFQGGCICETAPGLRIDTDNAEIAALTAPRPLLLVSAKGDWGALNHLVEWPTISQIYKLYGRPDRTGLEQFNYQHNLNKESREAVARWFVRWLKANEAGKDIAEKELQPLPARAPSKAEGSSLEAQVETAGRLVAHLRSQAEGLLVSNWPATPEELTTFKATYKPAFEQSVSASWDRALSRSYRKGLSAEGAGGESQGRAATRAQPPTEVLIFTEPSDFAEAKGLHDKIVARGIRARILPVEKLKGNPVSAELSAYNRSQASRQTEAILTAVAAEIAGGAASLESTVIVGCGALGPRCLLAAALLPDCKAVVADLNRLAQPGRNPYIDDLLLPGIRKIGGLPAAALLILPNPVLVYDAGVAADAFLKAEVPPSLGALSVISDRPPMDAIAEWIARVSTEVPAPESTRATGQGPKS